ncbi:NTP transferase domain-containing protein [Candidatus Peregrinibacteria bacterium]|nr:NTP transferase domain-containing protein [Candidatus Peregrinibacteria bacterium]
MKGIILAGGSGTRLHPLTKVTSKQLLPVYNKPMIYYPLNTLLKAGIKDILIIVAPEHAEDFITLLGSGSDFDARFSYQVQDKPEGLAQALILGEDFLDDESCALILGDNIFTDCLSKAVKNFQSGAKIFAKKVHDPERFGVVEIDVQGKVISLEEKPVKPKSNYAQTGFYLYDNRAVNFAKSLKPSVRGELEIVDLNNKYFELGELQAEVIEGQWVDAGTFESLHRASCIVREHELGMKGSSNLEVKIQKTQASKEGAKLTN